MAEHILHLLGPFEIPSIGRRHVRVYVPPREGGGAPPVLYLFDGQNLFHDEPSYAGGWRLHTTVCRLAKRGTRAPVIVGVDHGGTERVNELSPWPSARGGGRTDALLDWMIGALMPQIQADFGVASDPPSVGIGGSSMGGLAALYGHFRSPEQFGLVLSMSPSLWIGGGKIFEYVASRPKPWTSRIYLDAGALEAGGRMLEAAARFAGQLRGRGWDEASLKWFPSKRGTHSEKHWRRRAPGALEFLFGGAAKPKRKKA